MIAIPSSHRRVLDVIRNFVLAAGCLGFVGFVLHEIKGMMSKEEAVIKEVSKTCPEQVADFMVDCSTKQSYSMCESNAKHLGATLCL